jgi:hypothetical protein
MDTLTSSRSWLPALNGLRPGKIYVLFAPHAARALMLEAAGRLALRSTVRVLDGGNQFNAYHVARSIRRYTSDLETTLARIQLARAFTCYQVETLICGAASPLHSAALGAGIFQPAAVTLVLDLLATFNDDNVSLTERRRLLDRCHLAMRRIAEQSALLVGLRPARPGHDDQIELVETVLSWADDIWQAEVPAAQPALRLFA